MTGAGVSEANTGGNDWPLNDVWLGQQDVIELM